MTARFSGKQAIVTGAASGIGLAVAHRLASEGIDRLLLTDIDHEALMEAGETIERDGLQLELLSGDIGDPAFWDEHAPRLAGISCYVANAGVRANAPMTEISWADWRRVMHTNLDGTFLTIRSAFRAMIAQGGGGSIVCTGSIVGMHAHKTTVALGASKHASSHLAQVAAKEGAHHGIRVNTIIPGSVGTPMWRDLPFFEDIVEEAGSEALAFDAMGANTPLGRFIRPDELAFHICYLLSDEAKIITGTSLLADGGFSL